MGAIMEAFHCDWGDKGGNAGKCWECWKCEPCCGEPCNPMDGVICFLCFAFCGLCSNAKLYAYSMDQDCGLVNHFLYGCFCGLCMSTCLRGNLRTMHDVGEPGVSPFDCLMVFFCGSCAGCQQLRSVPKEAWMVGPVCAQPDGSAPSVCA